MPASHLSCHPIVNDGKVWKGEICDDFCVYMCLQICAWSWGMRDRYGYRVYVNSFCCILLYYYMYYCFVLCLDSG